MSTSSSNVPASRTEGTVISHGMLLSKRVSVFRRLTTRLHRPTPPPSGPVPKGRRKYPAGREPITSHGISTPLPETGSVNNSTIERSVPDLSTLTLTTAARASPFYLQTGYATFAKRASRPFPPPFLSKPSSSFSDPLTTHRPNFRDRKPTIDGEFILGVTNGDDAVFVSDNYLVVNDGVGAWAAKQRGHAALWSRLIGHFWGMEVQRWMAGEVEEDGYQETQTTPVGDTEQQTDAGNSSSTTLAAAGADVSTVEATDRSAEGVSDERSQDSSSDTVSVGGEEPNPVSFLQTAFEKTKAVTHEANDIVGTTTFVSALLYHRPTTTLDTKPPTIAEPLLYVTNLGDSSVLVIRPHDQEVIYHTKEQWHWFDCPRQLGTNSPDVPNINAVMDKVDVLEGDLVITVSDGVADNLWQHEVCEVVCDALRKWTEHRDKQKGAIKDPKKPSVTEETAAIYLEGDDDEGMVFIARELVRAARVIAEDPFAESPFMERAVEEGLAFEGGKMDDISAAIGRVTMKKESEKG